MTSRSGPKIFTPSVVRMPVESMSVRFLIGIVQQMSTLVLPYQLQNTAIFVVFLLIIFLRPQGMFGRISERT